MTVHLELTLATPLHSIHIGTEQYAHTRHCSAQWDYMSFPLFYSPLFPFPIILPLPLIPFFAQPFMTVADSLW